MKRLGLLAFLLANSSAYSLNIVQGWYGGILLGINYTPSTNYVTTGVFADSTLSSLSSPQAQAIFPNFDTSDASLSNPDLVSILQANGTIITGLPVTLKYGNVGQIALQTGYRCGHFRVEGQLGINNSPYSSLSFGNNVTVSDKSSPYYTFQGQTNTGYGMINGYYDVLPSDSESNLVPFIGAGIGYAYTQNSLQMDFWSDIGSPGVGYQVAELNIKQTNTSPAGQAMIGASYFLDDFSSFSLDLRYFTTQKKSQALSAKVEVLSVNLTFNGAFNFG